MIDFDLLGYHYWRECHACGHAEGGYLHCMHDGYQNPCHKCGVRMPTVKGECHCRFVLTHEELKEDSKARGGE